MFDATPGGEIISDNFEKNRGKLPWPIDKGNIKIHYGTYSIPGTKLRGTNPGLTMETEQGSSVKAIFDGEVVSVFRCGWRIERTDTPWKIFYNLWELVRRKCGQRAKVKAGNVIGKVGSNADGNGEFEFLLLLETRNLDPALWIRRK